MPFNSGNQNNQKIRAFSETPKLKIKSFADP